MNNKDNVKEKMSNAFDEWLNGIPANVFIKDLFVYDEGFSQYFEDYEAESRIYLRENTFNAIADNRSISDIWYGFDNIRKISFSGNKLFVYMKKPKLIEEITSERFKDYYVRYVGEYYINKRMEGYNTKEILKDLLC